MTRILAFHSHPDDVEFWMGGTLALLAESGCQIHIATMAGGEVGAMHQAPQNIRQTRLAESRRAADLIGATYHYAGGHDLDIQYDQHHRRMAVRIVREVDPDLVFAPPPSDYMIDHEQTSWLVRNAAFIASVPNFDCGVPTTPTTRIPHLYYCNAAGGKDPFGNELPLHGGVDVTDVINTKRDMLACHASQQQWLRDFGGMNDYLEQMEGFSRQDGKRLGVLYGEGFIQHLGLGHPQDNLLAELLPNNYIPLQQKAKRKMSRRDAEAQ